ncbi:hypothetical protein KR018_012288, partial [Drosophila ironensis]
LGGTTPPTEEDFGGSTSPMPTIDGTTDRLINGDLQKGARVEPLAQKNSNGKRTSDDDEQYDVIDVLASTGSVVGKPKSGQTTRIYTTGEVDESFWLKHLGDDFRHAIHLQVGGTNEEYNRLINQTQNGVHEEVHHEYLPGAEKPGGGGGAQNLDAQSLALKQQYLREQQMQHQSKQQHYTQQYTLRPSQPIPYRSNNYPNQEKRYIINSSDDQLHAAQSNPSPVRSPVSGMPQDQGEDRESFGSHLPFKSPFNDYGSRPTRDLSYLLYKRGL